jgi:uncharacterized protein
MTTPTPASAREKLDPITQTFLRACERLAGFDDGIDAEWVDGFLCAVAASPRAIPVDDWLPRLLPDGLFERTFADPEDAARGREALVAHAKALARALDPEVLMDEPDVLHLAPLMVHWGEAEVAEVVASGQITAEDAAEQLLTGAAWADGVIAGMQAFPDLWPSPEGRDADLEDDYIELLGRVSLLVLPPSKYAEAEIVDPPSRDEMVDNACYALQDLRLYWVDHAPKPETRRVEATPGRNDPCHCGSGRKYKKCHGA